MFKLKNVLSVFLILTLIASLCACGSKSGGAKDTAVIGGENFGAKFPDVDLSDGIKVTDEKITLTCGFDLVEIAGTLTRGEELLKPFREKYPNITINFEPMTNSDSRLMSMIAAGNGPDILRMDSFAEAPSMIARGLVLPLDKYFEAAGIKTDELSQVQSLFKFDGQKRGEGYTYGIVKDFSFDNAIWINKATFKEAGVEIPSETEPLTYTEFAELARKLTVKDGKTIKRFGFTTSNDIMRLVEPMLNSSGKSLWSEDGKKNNLTADYAVEAFNYWSDLMKEGVMPSTLHPISETDGFGSLVEGKVAMVIGGYWLGAKTTLYGDGKNEDIMLLPSPKAEGGKEINNALFGTGLGIFASTPNPNEAFMLLNELLLGEETVKLRAEYGWGVPIVKEAEKYLPESTPAQKQWKDVTLRQLSNYSTDARVSPFVLYNGATSTFSKYYNLFLYDKADLNSTLQKISGQLDILVEEGMAYAQQAASK